MSRYIEPTVNGDNKGLTELTAMCKQLEDNAANMSEAELAKAITEMNYETRVFLRPELKVITNENRFNNQ